MSDLKIYNGFGITPSKNYVAAGYDFHIPYLKDESKVDMMLDALKKSYKLDDESMEIIVNSINLHLSAIFDKEFSVCDIINITHLFLALTPPEEDEDEYDVRESLVSIISRLDDRFYQSHRACYVNKSKIKTIDFR